LRKQIPLEEAMSEYINNVTRRKEILKNVLSQLQDGTSIEAVKTEFGQLAQETTSNEIAEIEQMLINDGMPVESIQALCDVHVAVFRDGLEQQRPAETIPGHPVHTFRAENQVILRMLDEMHKTLDQAAAAQSPALLRTFGFQLGELFNVDRHYLRKENLLFPYLETYGFQGPSKVMWGIHDSIRAALREVNTLAKDRGASFPELQDRFAQLQNMMREMAYKEEKILFPAALEHLSEGDWASIRAQEDEFGYFLVVPGSEWRPLTAADLHAPTSTMAMDPSSLNPTGMLNLHTGALSLAQIDLMLRTLPVDITYVDENDTVCYFSQTRERIFDRTPAIIGRKVQNCHPPQSVGRVQRILDDFRAGLRDSAEFWIHMGPRFVHIRYFALRDEQHSYRGTIEVTQDIAPIQALQGDKRLLDDIPAQ
jgi:uncharacterized protein